MTTMPSNIRYIADADVDQELDLELRRLLSTCFTKPQDEVFKHRRYFHEPPAHRWLLRSEEGTLIAHLAMHERTLTDAGHHYLVGGMAEVCVHPAHRGRGHAKALVEQAHQWMREHGYTFSALFGDPRYYASSGYVAATNLFCDMPDEDGHLTPARPHGALVAQLTSVPWPQSDIAYLPGGSF